MVSMFLVPFFFHLHMCVWEEDAQYVVHYSHDREICIIKGWTLVHTCPAHIKEANKSN